MLVGPKLLGYLVFGVSLFLQHLVRVLSPHRRWTARTSLAIECGAEGWKLIEYQELFRSAQEFYGLERVTKCVIDRRARYLGSAYDSIARGTDSHRFLDPRTGSQNWLVGFGESFIIGVWMAWFGVVPVVALTDFPIVRHRLQAAILTASAGVVCTLMSPQVVGNKFPHRRLLGPMPMALSAETAREIRRRTGPPAEDSGRRVGAIFSGSLYEPRASVLAAIREELEALGKQLVVRGRVIGGARRPDSEYWSDLSKHLIVLSTADQRHNAERDMVGFRHLVYRYFEATAAGALLVGQSVSGLSRFLVPGEDFLSFDTDREAAEAISWALENVESAEAIARRGQAKTLNLSVLAIYWQLVETGLGRLALGARREIHIRQS